MGLDSGERVVMLLGMKKTTKKPKPQYTYGRTFDFDYPCNKVPLDRFLDWIKENVPSDAKDITISIMDPLDYYGNFQGNHIYVEWSK